MTASFPAEPPNPLRAAYYADSACVESVAILENVHIAEDTYRVRLECPEIARRIVPGQFLMVRLPSGDDPLLGRPLALYDTVLDTTGAPIGIDIVYLVVGKMTGRLAHCVAGDRLEVWGPLGNGFRSVTAQHVVLVAGGIGQTPFLALGRELLGQRLYGKQPSSSQRVRTVTLCYGARSANLLAGVEDFHGVGMDVRISTDDGSAGHHGLVTDLLQEILAQPADASRHVICCGPEAMMEAVANMCHASATPCLVSLETPMACGIGICFSCVAKVRQPDGTWDYKRTCVEGPVFDAEKIVWE